MQWHISRLLHERVDLDSFRAPAQTSAREQPSAAARHFYNLAGVGFENVLLRASPLF